MAASTAQRLLSAILILIVLSASAEDTPAPSPAPLSFGVVPQQATAELARNWTPVFQYLGERAGVELRFATAPDIPTFEQRMAAGEYDLAYMNPYHYTVFHAHPGYDAIARQSNKRIRGILVIRRDSDIEDIADLDGQTLAFPAPAAFAASVLPRAALKEAGIRVEPRYVRSHDSVYLAVAEGLYPAGGGIERTFANIEPELRDSLRVLWRTKDYTPHAFAAHPRVDPALVTRVRDAMLSMADDPDGRALLAALGFEGITAAQDSDWDDVRALGIDLLDSPIDAPAGPAGRPD
jgi:phosphonate transport system substrate-binding protein